jgi:hypothetical protein
MCGRTGAKEAFLLQGVWVLCAIKVPALSRRLSETDIDWSTTFMSSAGINPTINLASFGSVRIGNALMKASECYFFCIGKKSNQKNLVAAPFCFLLFLQRQGQCYPQKDKATF